MNKTELTKILDDHKLWLTDRKNNKGQAIFLVKGSEWLKLRFYHNFKKIKGGVLEC